MIFTHFLDDVQFYPAGDWKLSVKRADEDFAYCKDYRIKLEGEMIFSGDDHLALLEYDCCDQIEHKIYCDGVLHFVCYWGYPLQFEFDEDRCTTKGIPTTLDKYYWFDRNADESRLLNRNPVNTDVTWEVPNICDDNWIPTIRDRCTLLFWIIDWYVGQIAQLSAVSTFFENDLFPDGTNPYPAGPGATNYVTGFAQKLNHIVFAMARHIHTDTENPDYPTMSWNEFMTVLHDVFNTWWYIDESDDLRIEHISFWDIYFGVSYDLTTLDGGKWIGNSSQYSYLVDELPIKEVWNWNEHLNGTDFLEQEIVYDCSLGGTNFYIKEYEIGNLTTDLEYMSQNWAPFPALADVDSNAFMFLRCITMAEAQAAPYNKNPPVGTDYCVWYSQGARTGVNHLNAHLSASNLHVNYWMHDRPFWEGTMIGSANTIFDSTWRIMKQTSICFPVCCAGEAWLIDEHFLIDKYEFGMVMNEFITTQYGDGEIYTATLYNNGMMCTELAFENNCLPDGSATSWSDESLL